MRRLAFPHHAWLDLALATGILLGLNLLWAPHDIGWMNAQPTPYILLPILAGMRHGIGAGLMGGTVALLIGALGQIVGARIPWTTFFINHPGLFFWNPALGILCGAVQSKARSLHMVQLVRTAEFEQKLHQQENEVLLLRQAKEELERLLPVRAREQSALDAGLRWLSASPSQKLARHTLLLLNRQIRVTDAALYFFDGTSNLLHREAILGREDHLPPLLHPQDVGIARSALECKETVTVPELFNLARSEPQNYLAAVPLLSSLSEPFGLLLVTGMPFMAFTPKSLATMDIVCRWAAGFIETKDQSLGRYRLVEGVGDNQKVYSPEFFHHLVRIAADAFQNQRTLATLVLLCASQAPSSFQGELEAILIRSLRLGDYAAQLDLEIPHLVLLLPLTGQNGAQVFIHRMLSAWRHPKHALRAFHISLEQEADLDVLLCKAQENAFHKAEATLKTAQEQAEPCSESPFQASLP